MDCKTCEERISASLDAHAAIPADVQEHIDHCETCSTFHDSVMDIDTQLRNELANGTAHVSEGFHDRLMAKLADARKADTPEPKTFPWLAYAAAAVLALALLALLLNQAIGPTKSSNGNPVVDDPRPTPEQIVVLPPPGDLNEQFSALDSLLAKKTEEVYLTEVDNIKDDVSQAADFVLAEFR